MLLSSAITILGASRVGLTIAALLAHLGYTAYAIGVNPRRLNVIKRRRSFFCKERLSGRLEEKQKTVLGHAFKTSTSDVHRCVSRAESMSTPLNGAGAVITATQWPEFITHNTSLLHGNILVDAVNRFKTTKGKQAGLLYIGAGR